MKKLNKHLKVILMISVVLLVNLGFSQPTEFVSTSNKPFPLEAPKTGDILFDQISDPGNSWMISQHYSTYPIIKIHLLLQMILMCLKEKHGILHSIGVFGAYWQGAPGGGDTINVYILNDDNGMPGDTIHEYFAHTDFLNVEENMGDYIGTYFEIYLPSLVTLSEGTYWVSVQLYSDFDVTGKWGWLDHSVGDVIYGAEWHWINPKDGFGFGFTDWTPASVCVGPWVQWEMSFALYAAPDNNDVSALEITSPDDYYYGPPTDDQEVKVIVKNEGSKPQTGFDLKYNINGTEVIENIGSVTLDYNETYEYTFTQTVDLSTPGSYDLEVSTMLVGDENPDNDTQSIEITVFDPTVYTNAIL